MQDIQSIGGGGGARLFSGGGDRRLRPHQNNQPLKCPRCDSLNTKFCYYNNYNLSQPRHFCKNCRRYWTKGGVLRNVPVGGGCRKTKRSKPKQPAATPSSPAEAVTTALQQEDVSQSLDNCNNNNDKSSNSHSNSESSSLTATNTTTTANTTVEAVSSKATTPTNTTTNSNAMFSGRIEVETSKLFNTNSSFEQAIYEQYSDIGTLTGLVSTSSSENMGFGLGNMMNQQTTAVQVEQQQSLWEGGLDEAVKKTMHNEGSRGAESGEGFGGLDWQGNGDQGLFHIPNAIDQAYWTQNQWSGDQDNHPGLYLP